MPNVDGIDENGIIVRPPEAGWPGAPQYPESFQKGLAERTKQAAEAAAKEGRTPGPDRMAIIASGQDRSAYPDAIRDWARNGANSRFAMTPDQVVQASQPRGLALSSAAAHLELAN